MSYLINSLPLHKKTLSKSTRSNDQRGFTLIELLVVIAIIGLLSSTVLASLNTARAKARDAERFSDVNQIQKALELYYDDNGEYPPVSSAGRTSPDACTNGATGFGNGPWCELRTFLEPYLALPSDPLGPDSDYTYWFDADSGDFYQTYGLMIQFESESNYPLIATDGGYFQGDPGDPGNSYYEVGSQPSHCLSIYSSTQANWVGGGSNVCSGGN